MIYLIMRYVSNLVFNLINMENDLILIEIIKWYNEEKILINELCKDKDPKFQRYQDYQKRLIEIDKIIKEII